MKRLLIIYCLIIACSISAMENQEHGDDRVLSFIKKIAEKKFPDDKKKQQEYFQEGLESWQKIQNEKREKQLSTTNQNDSAH